MKREKRSRPSEETRRKQSASITRSIRMLRAHGMVQKTREAYRYKITAYGATLIAAPNAYLFTGVKNRPENE